MPSDYLALSVAHEFKYFTCCEKHNNMASFIHSKDGCEVFNIGRATHWAFADGLEVNPKADPETTGLAILILGQVARPSLC